MAEQLLSSIATRANYDELKRAQRLITEQMSNLDRAEQCGIECREYRAAAKQVLDRLLSIEQHFFTPPPMH